MSTQVLANPPLLEAGVDFLKVYRRCSYAVNPWEKPPSFEELYERFIEDVFEARTNIPRTEIDHKLRALREEHSNEVFDVERGFAPAAFGAPTRAQVFNALIVWKLCFEFKGQIINNPVTEVW